MSGNETVAVWPVLNPMDRRIHAGREGNPSTRPAHVSAAFVDLCPVPDEQAGIDTQVLHGENVAVLEVKEGWSRVQASRDRYVGWVRSHLLSDGARHPTHRIIAPRTFLYPMPDMKKPRCGYRSMGSGVVVTGAAETRGTRYLLLDSGEALVASHAAPAGEHARDYVSIAEALLRTPYLWGGSTAFGIDCSGLVSLSMQMAGKDVMRDSDHQAASIGEPVEIDCDWSNLERGDLIFWRGHVAIAQGRKHGVQHVIHANGNSMDVASEPVGVAVERIASLYEHPIGVRRP